MKREAVAPAICFDATGTLIEATASVGDVYRRVALEHGVDLPAWRLDDAFHRVLRHAPPRGISGNTRDEREANEIEWWFERIRQTFQATDSTVRFADFRGFANALFQAFASPDAWRARSGVRETLSHLATKDVFMAITSNFDHRLPIILKALELAEFFDFIEIPINAGRQKPERAVFEAVAARAARPESPAASRPSLESMVYVGDDAPDVLGEIAALGVCVFDTREVEFGAELADRLLEASARATAAILP